MKLRILMLAHRLPYPPDTGDKVRAFHVARYLAERHTVTLVCPTDEPDPGASAARLRAHVPDLEYVRLAPRLKRALALAHVLINGSATLAYFYSPALHRHVRERLRTTHFDVVYVSSSGMAPYVPGLPVPVIMDFVDMDSEKWLQYADRLPRAYAWIYRREGWRLRAVERSMAARAAHCLVATEAERALLWAIAPDAPVTVMPNGVDLDFFRPPAYPAADPVIVFTGAMDYFPNVDAACFFGDEILPRVQARLPSAQFLIVGKDPAPAVRRLSKRPGVTVTGSVPDVRPFLHRARVAVAPLRLARGVQNKILEAMATGLPVVATSKACQGLAAVAGRDLLVAEEPRDFADAVVWLLESPEPAQELGRAARTFVRAHHAWPAALAALDAVLHRVCASSRVLEEIQR